MTKLIAILLLIITISTAPSYGVMCKTTSYCPQESGGYYAYNGQKLHEGDCAADPNVFKFNSYLLINGRKYHFIDVGSAVKGHHVDIFCPNPRAMNQRGTQYCDVQPQNPMNPHKSAQVTAKPVYVAKNKASSAKFGANSKIFENSSLQNRKFIGYSSKRGNLYNKVENTEILICED